MPRNAKEPKSIKETNSSKTAHVMNLLSKNRAPEEPPVGITLEEAPVSNPMTGGQAPSILTSIQEDAAVSSLIKGALEKAADEEPPAPPRRKRGRPPKARPEPSASVEAALQAEEVPVPEPAQPAQEQTIQESPVAQQPAQTVEPPVQESPVVQPTSAEVPPAQEPVQEAPPVPVTAPPQETPQVQPVQEQPPVQPAPPAEEPEISYVNVMQVLVEEKAEKYMGLFGLCQCPRCKVDVKALALNGLPNKYVVMSKGEFVPRITVYEGQFTSLVTAQILHACKIVMESPRHE